MVPQESKNVITLQIINIFLKKSTINNVLYLIGIID